MWKTVIYKNIHFGLVFFKMKCVKRNISLLVMVFGVITLFAQPKIYTTQKLIGNAPDIDGYLDEAIWQQGLWEGKFYQNSPNNGETPSQQTSFKIYYDDDNIYVAIKSYDTKPDKIERRLSRRDGMTGDRIAIEFDSYYDKRTSFMFGVNAAGVKNDGIIVRDDGYPDLTADPIWFVKTQIVADGWQAEMKIPVSQLRFNNDDDKVWGLQIVRYFFRNQEYDTWQNVPDSLSGWVRNYGKLYGIKNLKPKKVAELAPYILGKAENYKKEEGNPFAKGREFGIDAGLDGKIGISNDFTLDIAINPDFGQVEADPSQLNLTAYETYYQEKRPFFLEGRNITSYNLGFGFTFDNLFYSRRIGRPPQGYTTLQEGEYVNIPERTKILGAIKLTGKTKKGWSLAIVESFTNNEKAQINNNGDVREESVEPYTNYFLARVQKDINKGNTIIGGIITNVYRDINSANLEFLNTTASAAGLDFQQFLNHKKHVLRVNYSQSYISGSKEAMLYQQLSSRRYYQRPDNNSVSLDTNITSLAGSSGTIQFAKEVNTGFTYGTFFTYRSSGFEANDLGYLQLASYLYGDSYIGYAITKPFSIFRRMSFESDMSYYFDWDGNVTRLYADNKGYISFRNFWNFNYHFARTFNITKNTLLRGGPAIKLPSFWEYQFSLSTNNTKKLVGTIAWWHAIHDEDSGINYELSGQINYRPINSLNISVYAKYGDYFNELQYVSEEAVGQEARYVFGSLNRETLFFALRIDFNISPEFTLQYYGSPYISGGLYNDFKRIDDPLANQYIDRFHTYEPNEISYSDANEIYSVSENANGSTDYSFYNPDFNFKQFRSNFVMRWEYRAGSAFYLVWSQSRTGIDYYGEFEYGKDIQNLFKVFPTDVLMLKFSYRFMN